MSSTFDHAAPQRFFRPADATRVRRNARRIQLQRAAAIVRNTLFAGAVIAVALWAYQRTQSDARFAVRHIDITGAVHTSRGDVERLTRKYLGTNLFRAEIATVRNDLRSLPWIDRIAIEKKLPDTLRINVIERVPVALVARGGSLAYVDPNGVILGRLSPAIGDADLPIVTAVSADELASAVRFLDTLRRRDPSVYSRVAEIRAVPPRGFAIFDREIRATVFANAEDISAKWRDLYAILHAEGLGAASIEYADLRFDGRVVVRPLRPVAGAPNAPAVQQASVQITN